MVSRSLKKIIFKTPTRKKQEKIINGGLKKFRLFFAEI